MTTPNDLAQKTQAVLEQDGILAQANTDFRARAAQLDMAQAVADAITKQTALVVEAGTGVGKTFAYLVPALLSGERVIVSTATKALQDQLFTRDLPYLCELLGLPLKVALLKGRSSYLCLHRMQQARQHPNMRNTYMLHTLARIEAFSNQTKTGDLADLDGLDERSDVLPLVTSTRENCLGSQCPEFNNCHVNQARRTALAADVVVINHHLFFADLMIRETGMAELLPSAHTVIFDEAHQLNHTGVQFLGSQLSSGHLLECARDILAGGLQHARGLAPWQQLAATIEQSARKWRLLAVDLAHGRWAWQGAMPDGISDADTWKTSLNDIQHALSSAQEALQGVEKTAPDIQRLIERVEVLQTRIQLFLDPLPADNARWMEISIGIRLIQAPLDIAPTMGKLVQAQSNEDTDTKNQPDHEKEHDTASQRAWVFTSATLGDDASLRWFTQPCGIEKAQVLQVFSPFNYAQHAAVFIPQLPLPSTPQHAQAVAQLAAQGAEIIGGRTLVLTTTLRNMRQIGEALKTHFADSETIEVLVQGSTNKRQLIERFRKGNANKKAGCILVASGIFWEGIDISGDALQLLIIDKLPFAPPNDPIVHARVQRINHAGGNAFKQYHLPEAAVQLKQGAGRLIRHENDKGVLVVCDSRLRSKSYGKHFIHALPPMEQLPNTEAFLQRLHTLNVQRG